MQRKETLIKKITKIQQKEVRWHVAQMFSYLRLEASETDRVMEILFEYLRDESRIVQTCALEALADIAALRCAGAGGFQCKSFGNCYSDS